MLRNQPKTPGSKNDHVKWVTVAAHVIQPLFERCCHIMIKASLLCWSLFLWVCRTDVSLSSLSWSLLTFKHFKLSLDYVYVLFFVFFFTLFLKKPVGHVVQLKNNERMMLIFPFPSFASSSSSSSSVVQCLEMTTKRKLIGRLVPCRCFRGEEEVISVLDYSHCSLQQVPKEIFSFERTLEELYLDANQIEELPKVILKWL